MNRSTIAISVPVIVIALHGCAPISGEMHWLEKSISSSAATPTLRISADRVDVGKGEQVEFLVTFLNPTATKLPLPVEGPSPDKYDRIQYNLKEEWYRKEGDAEGHSSFFGGVSSFYPSPPTTEPVLEPRNSRSYRLKWESTYEDEGYVVLAFDFNRNDDPPPLRLVLRTHESTKAEQAEEADAG